MTRSMTLRLEWPLGTSLVRLVLQLWQLRQLWPLWPGVLFASFLVVNPPDRRGAEAVAGAAGSPRKP